MKANTKKSAKSAKKQTVRHTMSAAQRTISAKFAALRAHLHKTFQSERTPQERKEQIAAFRNALKTAPAFIRERYANLKIAA